MPPSATLAAADMPPEIAAEISLVRSGSPNDRALHAERAASLALWYGDAQLASDMLDAAIREIETLYSGTDSQAAEARRLYHKEREKAFKGEPYERMMAYIFRGLLDYGEHDYSNAAASFRTAILQDAFADEQQSRCDFEVAEFLLSRTLVLQGADRHLIDEAYGAARELGTRHETSIPRADRKDNVLFFVEVGPSPFKVSQGEHEELLVIGRRGASGMHATIAVDDGTPRPTKETGNLAFQAQTRGGRQFDFILTGKAYTKQVTEEGGVAINQIGTALSFVVPPVGAALQLASLVVIAAGIGVAPQADTRYWDTLPDSIHVVSLRLEPGRHSIAVQFFNQFGKHLDERDQTLTVDVGPGDGDQLLWLSSQDRWPHRALAFGQRGVGN